jgi:hypothetical protein
MKRKKIKILFLVIAGFILFAGISFELAEKNLRKKLSSLSGGNLKVGNIGFSFLSLKINEINYKVPEFGLSLKNFRIYPVFTGRAFAFSGPGEIIAGSKDRNVSLKGAISGNLKDGNVDIHKVVIEIEKIGNFVAEGSLKQWGKKGISATVDLKGTEIKEVGKLLQFEMPFTGKVFGRITIKDKEGKIELINFNIHIKDIVMEGSPFRAFLEGTHNIQTQKTVLKNGLLEDSNKGSIKFNGSIDKTRFDMQFETKEMSVESLLRLLPEEIKEKYKLKATGGSVSMHNFNVIGVKKNLILQGSYPCIFQS